MDKKVLLSSIPKVDDILCSDKIKDLFENIPRTIIIESVRETLKDVREYILKSKEEQLEDYKVNINSIIDAIAHKATELNERHLKRVINGAGVIIHTNLGRSVLCEEAVEAVIEVAKNYSNLEYDLCEGKRGSRYSHVEDILVRITCAESAMVVNNNAAAVLLVLSTLCKDKQAVVSRGELVEIGGSFRIPEVMEQSGARLLEVGATNRTHLYDYERAINENTGVLLKVHTSNYRILGYAETVKTEELVSLAGKYKIPVIEDIGSGSFIDFSKYGISYEPTVQEAVGHGVDVVTFSGDKMLGGPQAGIIVGRKKYIDMMKKNPLTRALRVDKMTIAAMEVTLKQYLEEEMAIKNIPTLSMITEPKEKIKEKARKMQRMLKTALKDRADISLEEEFSEIGGGSMPTEKLPTFAVSIKPKLVSVNSLENSLRNATTPIIVRTQKDSILLDMRTIREDEYPVIRDTLSSILREGNL